MADSTRALVSGSTFRVPFTTCDTVDTETPATRATSTMLAIVTSIETFAPTWSASARWA